MGIAFRHSGRLGDIVYSLAFVKSYCHIHNVKAIFYVMNDFGVDVRYEQNHPAGSFLVSQPLFNVIEGILLLQDYIESVHFVSRNHLPNHFIDLDLFRSSQIRLDRGLIQVWYRTVFSIPVPVEQAWLTIPEEYDEKQFDILINKSSRYYNERINYAFLKQFKNVGFIGLEAEYNDFKKRHALDDLVYVKTNNALEMVVAMKKSKLFIGNQSFAFSLAEAIKVPRALDMYNPAPNVVPVGGVCIEFYKTEQIINFINSYFSSRVEVFPDLKGDDVWDIWAPLRVRVRSRLLKIIKTHLKKIRNFSSRVLKVLGI